VAALAFIQYIRYGSAFASGYGPMRELFAWTNVGPNLDRYPRWMFETHTPIIALFVLAPLWIARRRRESRMPLLLLWAFAVSVVLAYLPYVYFQAFEWTYTRFLLPALPLMWLLIMTLVTDLARRTNRVVGPLAVTAALICLVMFSIKSANDRHVFQLQAPERRYTFAGDYVRRLLPANSIIISVQHSGSVWFYTNRPILRWDHLEPRRFDRVLEWLSANGFSPFMVVDREELDRVRRRFTPAGQRGLDRLRPLAAFGDVTIYGFD
jgi:hypothetical protein